MAKKDDYGQLTVSELRRLMRSKHKVTRGAFSTEASREECLSILRGEREAVDVIAEHWRSQPAPKGGSDDDEARSDADAHDGPPEGEHGEGRSQGEHGEGRSQGEHGDGSGHSLEQIERMMHAIGRDDLAEATSKAGQALRDAEASLARLSARPAMSGPEPGTDLEASGDTVSIMGHDFPVVLKAEDQGGDAEAEPHPDLAAMPEPDPRFRFGLFKARLQCGAVRFDHEAADVLKAIVAGDRVLLTGPPGTGKTQMVQQACIRMRWPYERFNGNRDVTQADFVGQYEARDGSTVWVDGPLPRAMRSGKVLILDEFDHMPAECSSIMHSVMEPGGRLVMTAKGGEVVKPHANFRVVATANTAGHGDESGQHPAAQVQDAAMRSRFDLLFHVAYLDVSDEADLVASLTGVDRDDATLMARVASDSRQSVAAGDMFHAISLRETLAWGRATSRGGDIAYGLAVAVLGKLPAVDRPGMAEIAQRHLGDRLPASLVSDE